MSYNINGHDLVVRIDTCLKAMGLGREDLANHIGKNKQVFTDWKNCNIIPKSDDLFNMSRFLGVPMEYLLTGENIMPDDVAAMAAMIMTFSKEQREQLYALIKAQMNFWKEKESH